MPRSKPGKRGKGSSTSGKLGRKAPNVTVEWGPVTIDADGNVISVEPAKHEPKPKKPRRRS